MKKFNNILKNICGVILIIITVIALTQVFNRYVLSTPIPWLEEVMRYSMILMVFLAAGVAILRNEHFNLDIIDQFLNTKRLRIAQIIRLILVTIFSLVFTYQSFLYMMSQLERGQVSPALQISMVWPLLGLFIGGLIMIVNSVYAISYISRNKESVRVEE